jgi:hypothetical protein
MATQSQRLDEALDWLAMMWGALWRGTLVVIVAAYVDLKLPANQLFLKQVAQAFAVAGAVDVLFQFITFRGYFSNLLADQLRDALLLKDSFLSKLRSDEAAKIRRRCTEKIIGVELPQPDSLYDMLTADLDVMIAAPYASNSRAVREHSACMVGAQFAWRVEQHASFCWRNDTNRDMVHDARLCVELAVLAAAHDPIQDVVWSVAGDQIEPQRQDNGGGSVSYSWSGKVRIPANSEVEVTQTDVRYVPLEDIYTYTPSTPHKGMHVTCTFDRMVHPRIRYLGYRAKADATVHESPSMCQLIASGWHLWDSPGFSDEEKKLLPVYGMGYEPTTDEPLPLA